MKQTLHLLLILLAVMIQSCAFDRVEPSPYDLYRVEVDTYLNIRTTPSKKATVIGTFSNGTLVDVVEMADGWAKVSYRGEDIGYVSSDFLVLVRKANKKESEDTPDESGDQEFVMAVEESSWNVFFTGDDGNTRLRGTNRLSGERWGEICLDRWEES